VGGPRKSHLRVIRVHDRGDAGGEERDAACILGDRPVGLLSNRSVVGVSRHGAIDNRHVHSSFLPDVSALHDAGDATTKSFAGPGILAELGPVDLLNGSADRVLSFANGCFKAATHATESNGREGKEISRLSGLAGISNAKA